MTWRDALVAVVCLAASAAMLSPFVNFAHLDSALSTGDGRLYAWGIAWLGHAITQGLPIFDANMFYPVKASLAETEHFFTLGLLGLPLWTATGNAVLVFNVLQLAGPAATSFAAFLLFRAWTGDWLVSVAGGLLFGLSFFTMLHNAHLGLTWAAGLPLSMLLLERWWRHPTWTALAVLWIVCVLTALVSWYLAVILAVVVGIQLIVLLVTSRPSSLSTHAAQAIAAIALGVAVLLPFAAPYLGRPVSLGEGAGLSADARSFLVPPEHTVIGRWLVNRGLADPQGIWGERTLFLGWTAIGLACLGLVESFRIKSHQTRARVWCLLAILIVGTSLSFGPSTTGLMPFDLLQRLPGFAGFRASGRFALLTGLSVAAFVVFGLGWIRRAFPRAAPAAIVSFVMLVMFERFVVDFPVGHPQPESTPDVYALARADNARAVIALPIYAGQPDWFFETDYLLYSTTIGFLPLANGYGRWAPLEYLAIAEAMRSFPSRSSADALRFYGITHVILHGRRVGDAGPGLIAQARQSTDYRLMAERGADALFRVVTTRTSS